ncbi:rubredoxin-NAD(+) reductase [Polyplosphaeria fusca]|uniref:Rubredoxin-NAD(+) reductase n=1 Tax=Polyplosphaeria fusca TaxID=682080 RepID=A0A9P4QR62_9PLEO|nr:rubredoxin-NAD(+) reductase [Polyplosphaeria fusca]
MAQEFKLKGLTSLNLKNGEKQEVEVEGVEGGKVLLLKVQDEVHATSANCTHFGAPLKNGVLTPDGRLTCPWHGACFNVSTGDVEDAPALDPLSKYELTEKDGAVFVKTDESTLKANRRFLNLKCSSGGNEKVLVIGGGSGTLGAIEGLRGGGYNGQITVVSKEGHQPIDRTKLSKALLADLSKAAWRSKDFYKDASIDFIEDEVKSVDFGGKKVTTASGNSLDYTKLVLATGGTPRWLPLPGLRKGELGNVFVLRALPDTQGIVKAVGDNGKKIVVIGSSFIGMEVGNCLAGMKNDVSIIGMESEPMERVMGSKVGKIFRGLLEKNGVKFYMGASVEKASPSKSDTSKVGAVHLKDGTVLEADLVIEGVGVAPATEYLKESGVTLEKDGSLKTNESFEVEGLGDVYAIGDIATYPYHGPGGDGALVRIEHWNVAQNAGRSVANSIAHPGAKAKPFIPVFWSALGSQLRYCGNTVAGYDDIVLVGEAEKPSFIAYYTKGETVVAVATMMKDPYMVQSAELMRRGKMATKSELQKGVDILELEVPPEIKM